MPECSVEYGLYKTRTLILLAVQCAIGLFVLIGAVPFSIDSDITFAHSAIRPLIVILLTITLLWFISTLLALVVVIRDQKRYLRFHICLNTVILFIYFAKLIVLLFSDETVTTVFCIFVNFVNFLSVFHEFKLLGTF
ncbi:hypothetical protein L5515_015922 [Caenorhabditis briggsae]|uniref:Uncharacterized protein n=1 Tax=Caenorhabditis briggsae TaxID=6238 RepID=A0AAE9ECY6_CAEBR|nr:hypothetical protein L5515_015922 [Caenorhabditis briggsae]